MPTKLVTLIFGLACGFGLALAIPALGNRDRGDDRWSDRDEGPRDRRDGNFRGRPEVGGERPGMRGRDRDRDRDFAERGGPRGPRDDGDRRRFDDGDRHDRFASRDGHDGLHHRGRHRHGNRGRDRFADCGPRGDEHHRSCHCGSCERGDRFQGQHGSWRSHRDGDHHPRFAEFHRHRDRFEGGPPWHHRSHFGRHHFRGRESFGPHGRQFAAHHGWGHHPRGEFGHHRRHFARMEFDGDGKITKEELLKLFGSIDKNGDGAVTKREFIHAIVAGSGPGTHGQHGPKGEMDGRHRGDAGPPHGGPPHHGLDGRGPGRFGFGGPGPHHRPSATELMERFDREHKGSLTKKDVPEPVWNRISKADTNSDGTVTKDELEAHIKKMHDEHQSHETKPAPADSAKPNSPVEEKPKDPKPDDTKAQTLKIDTDSPADALHPSNVGD